MTELARVRTHRDGSTQLVRVTGEVDLSNARDVIEAIGHAVPDDVTRIVLDLTDTTYVDSAAIATLFRLSERLRDRRQDLRLVVPHSSPIRSVVELTRLSQVIPVDEVAATGAPVPSGPSASSASSVSSASPSPYAAVPDSPTAAQPARGEVDRAEPVDSPVAGPDDGLGGPPPRSA